MGCLQILSLVLYRWSWLRLLEYFLMVSQEPKRRPLWMLGELLPQIFWKTTGTGGSLGKKTTSCQHLRSPLVRPDIFIPIWGGESIIIDTTKGGSVLNTRSRTLSYSQSASKAQETFTTSNLDGDFGAMTTSFVCKHPMMYKYIPIYIYVYNQLLSYLLFCREIWIFEHGIAGLQCTIWSMLKLPISLALNPSRDVWDRDVQNNCKNKIW